MQYLIGIGLWALIPGFIAKGKGRSFWGYYFLSFLITPLITMIVALCVKSLNTGEANASSAAHAPVNANSSPMAAKENTAGDSAYSLSPTENRCLNCGFKLLEGSAFCSYCGTAAGER